MRIEPAGEDCSCDCERPATVNEEQISHELVDYPNSLGRTYTIPHDISRPSVTFLRNGRWRSLTNAMGKTASAKSQIALIASQCLALRGFQDWKSRTAVRITQSHEDLRIVAMARSLRLPQFRCGLALTKAVACRWDSNNGHDRNDGVREQSVQLCLSLLEHPKQEHADGNLAGRKAKYK